MALPDRFKGLVPSSKKDFNIVDSEVPIEPPKVSYELEDKPAMVLHQFMPAWDVQAYMRFAQLSVHVQNTKYPQFEATGSLPQLSDGQYLLPAKEIIPHLQSYHKDIDEKLTDREKSEAYAYRTMVQEKLSMALSYSRWLDVTNYTEVTRPSVYKVIPFPLNAFLPTQLHRRVSQQMENAGLSSKVQVYALLRDCYASLSDRLGQANYFFEDRPTSLDAVVFGHVVDAWSDIRLREVLQLHGSTLISHAERIRSAFFHSSDASFTTNSKNAFNHLKNAFKMEDPQIVTDGTIWQPYRTVSIEMRKEKIAKRQMSQAEQESLNMDKKLRNRGRLAIAGTVVTMILYGLSIFLSSSTTIGMLTEEDEDEDDNAAQR